MPIKIPCLMCPRECRAQRNVMNPGLCGASEGSARFRVAKVMSHMWEEPYISGSRGSGTVFFSGCHLGCAFCQNYQISAAADILYGQVLDVSQLTDEICRLVQTGVHNLNLVSATHYTELIPELISQVKARGVDIPVVWNSSSYEKSDSLALLSDTVDIYLPDLKFAEADTAERLAKAADYPQISLKALREMLRQQPACRFDSEGMLLAGVAIRHLILPGYHKESMKLLELLSSEVPADQPIALMSQYTPVRKLCVNVLKNEKPLHRQLTTYEYEKVTEYAVRLGFTRLTGQCRSSADMYYTPDFSAFRT